MNKQLNVNFSEMDNFDVLKKEILDSSSAKPVLEIIPENTPTLVQNYSILLNKLEQLAALSESTRENINQPFSYGTVEPKSIPDAEYSRVISDIWIGVVLTLLILSTVFFICSCFLYHKFQKWKHSYQTHNPVLPEVTRRSVDIDLESLPSYTICSGLPTYDDALDQFRKYGIILQPPSIIKIFEENKENEKNKPENISQTGAGENDDRMSVISSCTCGANNGVNVTNISSSYDTNLPAAIPNVIELNPEQLQMLSQKRLSIQIALNNGSGLNSSIRRSLARNSRINLFREVSRNNLLRSHEITSIHRSASQQSLHPGQMPTQRSNNGQHRGSLF